MKPEYKINLFVTIWVTLGLLFLFDLSFFLYFEGKLNIHDIIGLPLTFGICFYEIRKAKKLLKEKENASRNTN